MVETISFVFNVQGYIKFTRKHAIPFLLKSLRISVNQTDENLVNKDTSLDTSGLQFNCVSV